MAQLPSKKSNPDRTNARADSPIHAPIDTPIDRKIDDVLAQLWKKNLPTVRERLDLLDKFAAAASSGKLDESARVEALNIAHKLAGSLGMYGYQQGTEVASKMEGIFKSPTPEKLLTLPALSLDLRKSLADGL